MRDDLFAADFLNIIGDFSRTNNINITLIFRDDLIYDLKIALIVVFLFYKYIL